MKASAARRAALEVVTRVRERSAYAHETLDTVLSTAGLDARDAALATRLAYGTIAVRGTLDEAIMRQASPGTTLEPRVADALALGAYELLFAETPTHAVVSEAVELVKEVQPRASGLANALMRKLDRAATDFPWGEPAQDNAALARLYGHPRWLAELWISEIGRDRASAAMEADNEPAPLYLARVDSHLPDAEVTASLESENVRPVDGPLTGCWTAGSPADARRASLLRDNRLIVMDAAAQLTVDAAVPPSADSTLVELGAGRGGKTLLLAARAAAAGRAPLRVVAVDLHEFKLSTLEKHAAVLGYDFVETVTADASKADSDLNVAEASADVVLVDAPCSGLGTLRRHPDRRWRATYDEVETLALLGSQLLARAARLVKPGGFVVYSTCTITRKENAEVIEGFLGSEAGKGFTVDSLERNVPSEWSGFVTPEGFFQSLPAQGGPDGHFIARLRCTRV